MALAQGQEVGKSYRRRRRELSPKGAVKIAFVPLYNYKPEEITLEVDNDNVILHGKHRSEREDGFDTSEFKRVFKLPQEVDPTAITSRATQNGDALINEGTKREEEKTEEGKFEAKFDFSGFKPEEIKIQLHGNELSIGGKHTSEDSGNYRSRDYSRTLLLPDDIVVSSVTSCLSKEGQLTIEASRDPALLPGERNVDVIMETDEVREALTSTQSGKTEN